MRLIARLLRQASFVCSIIDINIKCLRLPLLSSLPPLPLLLLFLILLLKFSRALSVACSALSPPPPRLFLLLTYSHLHAIISSNPGHKKSNITMQNYATRALCHHPGQPTKELYLWKFQLSRHSLLHQWLALVMRSQC